MKRTGHGEAGSLGGVNNKPESPSLSFPPLDAKEEEGVRGGVIKGMCRRGEVYNEFEELNLEVCFGVVGEDFWGEHVCGLVIGRDDARSRGPRLLRGWRESVVSRGSQQELKLGEEVTRDGEDGFAWSSPCCECAYMQATVSLTLMTYTRRSAWSVPPPKRDPKLGRRPGVRTSCDPSDQESYKSGCKRGGVQDSVGESDQVGVRKKERT